MANLAASGVGQAPYKPLDPNSVVSKTTKGLTGKPEEHNISHDCVRLLRLVNGKASIRELRSRITDLTDYRFETALGTLQNKGLVQVLSLKAPAPSPEAPGFDAKMQDLQQDVLQSLDFTKLQRTLLDAMRSSQGKAEPPSAPTTPKQPAPDQPAVKAHPAPDPPVTAQSPPIQPPPTSEVEIRDRLIAALRPKIENELRTTLTNALRPALEAEIRSKLIAALKPRVEQELRARLNAELAQRANAATAASAPLQQLLACLQETVFQNDLEGKTVFVNAAWTQLTGASVEDTIGGQFADSFTPADQKGVTLFLDRTARSRETPPWFEARLVRKKGGLLRIELRAAPLTTPAGGVVGVCGTLRVAEATPD